MKLLLLFIIISLYLINHINGQNNIIHGHIIPHSHCDPGWLDTFEQYYIRDVKMIIDNVVSALHNDKSKRFIWAETSFFARWYEMKTSEEKKRFRQLVKNGQWEFVGGGWSQNDEALPDVTAWISQHAVGHQYLLENFGIQPRIAWQIDPFGHSSVTPSLAALAGYDALVINRIYFGLKAQFISQKHMEFLWHGANVGGSKNTDMFTHVLHTHYSAPQGFDWEEGAMAINSGNVHFRAVELCNIIKQRATAYRTRHLLIPFGDDFKFKNAGYQFSNMDLLIKQINSKPHEYGCRIQYSTVQEYFNDVHKENIKFPVYSEDFFPYADNDDSYWTGFYTTRPFMKAMHRRHSSILRSAEIMHALVRSNPNPPSNPNPTTINRQFWENQFQHILSARRDAGLFLHHDAITGTSRGQVVTDYMDRMVGSSRKLLSLMQNLLQHTLTKHPNESPKLTTTSSILSINNKNLHPIVIYNNLAWSRKSVITLRVASQYAYVSDEKGDPVQAQIDPFWEDFSSQIPARNIFSLHFIANLPPFGANVYFIQVLDQPVAASSPLYKATKLSATIVYTARTTMGQQFRGQQNNNNINNNIQYKELGHNSNTLPYIQNDLIRIELSNVNGLITSITDRKQGVNIPATQTYAEYTTERSGAYIFRPTQAAREVQNSRQLILRISSGWILNSYSLKYSDYDIMGKLPAGNDPELAGQLFLTQNVVARANQELIVKFNTKLNNGNIFYTNNALEWRQRTHREFPLAANFYPAVYGCRLNDQSNNHRFMIGTAHSMGCASQGNGEIELMLHRSMNQDDGRGLAQAVVDGSRVDVPIIISVDQAAPDDVGKMDQVFYRRLLRLNNPTTVFYTLSSSEYTSVNSWTSKHLTNYSPLNTKNVNIQPFPNDVHVLTFAARDAVSDDIIIQLQSLSQTTKYSKQLRELFNPDMKFKPRQLKPITASWNYELSSDIYPKPRLQFLSDVETSSIQNVNLAAATTGLAKQNTAEAGVFISKAALERSSSNQNVMNNQQPPTNQAQQQQQQPSPNQMQQPAANNANTPTQKSNSRFGIISNLWGGNRRRLLVVEDVEPLKLMDEDEPTLATNNVKTTSHENDKHDVSSKSSNNVGKDDDDDDDIIELAIDTSTKDAPSKQAEKDISKTHVFSVQGKPQPQPTAAQSKSQPQPTAALSKPQPQPTAAQSKPQPQPTAAQSKSQPQPTAAQSKPQPQPTAAQSKPQPQPTAAQSKSQPQPTAAQSKSQPTAAKPKPAAKTSVDSNNNEKKQESNSAAASNIEDHDIETKKNESKNEEDDADVRNMLSIDSEVEMPNFISVDALQIRSYVFNLLSSQSPVSNAVVPVKNNMKTSDTPSSTLAKPMWGKQLYNAIFSKSTTATTTTTTAQANSNSGGTNTVTNNMNNNFVFTSQQQNNNYGLSENDEQSDLIIAGDYSVQFEVWLPGFTEYAFMILCTLFIVYFYSWRLRLLPSCLCFNNKSY